MLESERQLLVAVDTAHDRVQRLKLELATARRDLKAAERLLRERRRAEEAPLGPLFDPPAQEVFPVAAGTVSPAVREVGRTPVQVHYPDGTTRPLPPGHTATRGGAIVPTPPPTLPANGLPLGTAATQDGIVPQLKGEVIRATWHAWDTRTDTYLGKVRASTPEAGLVLAFDHWPGIPRGDIKIRETGPAAQAPAPAQPAPPTEQAVAPAEHLSWDQRCDFLVTLADGQTVGCTWEPDRLCGSNRGALTFRGAAISLSGHLQTTVGEPLRTTPLPELARNLAQEAADQLAARLAKPAEPVKEPNWSAARKDDLASGMAKPRKPRKPRVKKTDALPKETP